MRRVKPNALHNQSIASPMSGYASSGITMLRGIDRLESIELIIPVGPGGPPFPYERTECQLAGGVAGGSPMDFSFLGRVAHTNLGAPFARAARVGFCFVRFCSSHGTSYPNLISSLNATMTAKIQRAATIHTFNTCSQSSGSFSWNTMLREKNLRLLSTR